MRSLQLPLRRRTDGLYRLKLAELAAEVALSAGPITPQRVLYVKAGLALLAVQKGDKSAAKEHHAYLLEVRPKSTMTQASPIYWAGE